MGDGTTIKTVEVGDDANLFAGAVTAYAGGEDINMVQADNSAISPFANKMADDATVVYVNTADTKGVRRRQDPHSIQGQQRQVHCKRNV